MCIIADTDVSKNLVREILEQSSHIHAMEVIDAVEDTRSNCYSILTRMTAREYLDFVRPAYEEQGRIYGQRPPLKTRSAQRVRERMLQDMIQGAVFPPMVLGLLYKDGPIQKMRSNPTEVFKESFKTIDPDRHIGIIDGMQRTTAMMEAIKDPKYIDSSKIRVEFWVSVNYDSLIYRMLILNTGQIPWNLRRQIETIFQNVIKNFQKDIPKLSLLTTNNNERRKQYGQYQADQFIELFILFGLRKNKASLEEQIAEEFARIDLIDNTSKSAIVEPFKYIVRSLVLLDEIYSKAEYANPEFELGRFKAGIDIFTSQPARVGFIVACSKHIYGMPGYSKPDHQVKRDLETLTKALDSHIWNIEKLTTHALEALLELPTLDERLKVKSGKVGEYEREFFTRAFDTLISTILNGEMGPGQSYATLWLS